MHYTVKVEASTLTAHVAKGINGFISFLGGI